MSYPCAWRTNISAGSELICFVLRWYIVNECTLFGDEQHEEEENDNLSVYLSIPTILWK